MKTFKKYLNEQTVNEISDTLADKVRRARYTATNRDRKNKEKSAAFRKNTELTAARQERQRKHADKNPNIQKIKQSANQEYEYNKSRGLSNEETKNSRIATDAEHKKTLDKLSKMPEFKKTVKSLAKRDSDKEYDEKKKKEYSDSLKPKNEDAGGGAVVSAPTNVTGPQSGTDPVSATAVKPKKKPFLFRTKRNPPKM